MRFFRQTLLSVCLIVPCVFAAAQPTAVEDNPPAVNEDDVAIFDIVGNDTDPTFTIDPSTVDLDTSTPGINDPSIVIPAVGSFSVDPLGTVTFTPFTDFSGPVTLPYTIQNSNGDTSSPPGNINIMVIAVNDSPTITNVVDPTINEDNATAALSFTIADVDDAIGISAVSASSSDQAIVPDGNIVIGGAGTDLTVTVTPLANQNGPVTITLTVTDGASTPATEAFIVTINPVSDSPTVSNITDPSIAEDNPTAGLSFNVGDIDDPVGSLTSTGASSNQTIVPDANIVITGTGVNRTVVVTPLANQNGSVDITITVSDGVSTPATETFTVSITPVNDAPTITAILDQSIPEDGSTGAVAFTIADIDNPVGNLTVTAGSSNQALIPDGNVVLGGSGSSRTVTVTPLGNLTGSSTITITVSDGPLSPTETFLVTVNDVSDPPTVTNIVDLSINEDAATAALAFTIGDMDDPIGSLTLAGVSSDEGIVPNGNIVFGGSGTNRTVTVTPLANQNGPVTITITVSDGTNNTPESFVVSITPLNDAPTITAIIDQSIPEDGSTGPMAFTIGDVDNLVGSLTVTAGSSNQALIPDGNVVLGGSGASRTVTVSPLANLTGSSTITITVSDGTLSPTETFLVTVNGVSDPPTITNVGDLSINEDAATAALAFTIGDIDDPIGSLTVAGTSSDEAIVPNGNIVFGGSGTNRTVTVTPLANQNGPVTITITVGDGTNNTPESFVVSITPLNDAPTITVVGNQTINEDVPTGALPFTVGDIDNAVGTLTVTGTSSATGIIPNANIVFGGSGASRTVTITPTLNQNGGPVTITLTVGDGVATNTTSFTVNVTPINDLPTITTIPNQSIAENTSTAALNFTVGDVETAAASLTLTGSSNATTLIPNANIVFGGSGAARTVTVTPAANQNGTATITINVNDGTGTTSTTFNVVVNAVNSAPTITAIGNQTINEDGTTGPLPFTIADADDAVGTLTVVGTSSAPAVVPNGNIAIGGSGASRTVTVTPLANQNGTVTITLTVSDGTASTTEIFDVTITPVNDAPTISSIPNQTIPENGSTGTLNFTIGDVENGAGTLTLATSSSLTTLIPNANIVFGGSGTARTVTITPAANQNGMSTITITVGDGTATTSINFNVTVSSVNSPPTITSISNQTINEDNPTGALAFTVNDLDDPVGTLTVTGVSNATTIVPNANIVFGGSGASRTVTVTPLANQNGPVVITLTVSDGTDTNSTTLNITVSPVSDAPTISAIANQTIGENTPTGALPFTVADIDDAVGTLVVTGTSNLTTLIPNANIVFGGSGANRTVTITPAANQNGTATITITVTDGTTPVTETFDVIVSSVNSAPTITAIPNQTINEDVATAALAFTLADLDDPVASLTVSAISSATTIIPNANVVFAGTGASRTVTVTPAANQNGGPVTVTLTVSDGTDTNTITFDVTITPVNDVPTITPIAAQSFNEDGTSGPLSFTINDIETAVTSLTVSGSSNDVAIIPDANIVFGGSGASQTVTVTPLANQNGPVIITLGVNDGTVTTQTTFNVTVVAVNDPPTITSISNQTVNEDTPTLPLAFVLGDIDNAVGTLTVSGSSDNITVVPDANIVFGGSGANRTVTITPAANAEGTVIITLTVSDGTATSTTTFQVTVSGDDDSPSITTIPNQTISEDTPTGVLAFTVGDAETPVASLTVTGTSDNTGVVPDANIVISGTGAARSVQVSPAPNQSGAAVITLTVNDGTHSTSTTFQVTINTVNDAPTITTIGNQTISEDTPTGALAFTIGDVETSVALLTVTATSDNITLVPNANIVMGGAGANQTVQVTPVANQFGVATITVNVNDGVNSTSTSFQVNVSSVNDLPTISAIANQAVNEDNPTGALAFTVGDTETAVATLTVTGSSDNTALVPNTNIVFGGTGASRTVTVTPASNQVGVAVITITLNDGTGNATTSFQLTVNAVNDLPSITSQATLNINEEQPYDIQFTDLVVTDVDNPYPTGFTLTVLGNPGYSFVGTTITPNTNVTGNIVVRVQVHDGTGLSNIYNLQVNVAPVNDPPTITANTSLSVSEEGSITVVLGNFTIVDPDNTSGFTISLGGGANYTLAGNTVTPALNFNGPLTIPVTVSDGNSSSAPYSLTIQVNPVNDKPEIIGQDLISIAEVQPVTIDLSQLTIFDPDNTFPDDFSLFVLGGPNYSAIGNTITPIPNYSGTLPVQIFVSDGAINSNTYSLQILVNSTNDPPVITGQIPDPMPIEEGQPLTILLDNLLVTDPDNSFPTGFTLTVLNSTNYTVLGNTVTPAPNVTGLLLVKVKVSDGAVDSAPYDLKVNVANVNDAPVISGQQNVTVVEDNPVTLRLSDLIVTDPDSPPAGFIMTALDGPNYSILGLVVTPDANFAGELFVPVVVSDGTLNSQPYDVRIVVSEVNDAPVITANVELSTWEDQPITLKFSDFTVTDVDNTYPTGFTFIVQGGGNHTVSGNVITPNPDFSGTLDVGVSVRDPGNLSSGIHSTQIMVNVINDAPTLDVLSHVTIQEDPTEISVIPLAGISAGIGEGGQSLTVTAFSDHPDWFEPFEVQYTNGPTGNLRLKPKVNIYGTTQVTVRVEDNGPATPAPNVNVVERTFNFIVEPVNDPPVFTSQPVTLIEAGMLYEYLIVATDIESEVISIAAPTLPPWLTITPTSNGNATLSGTAPTTSTGPVPVELEATDPMVISATKQSFEIVINSRPIITSFTIVTDEEKNYGFEKEFSNSYTDVDANPLTEVQITTLPKKGVLKLHDIPVALNAVIPLAELENLEYVPMTDSTGTDVIGWNASDGIYFSQNPTTVTITINEVNDPPEIIALEAPEIDTLKYEFGSEIPVKLTRIFDARDAEDDNITSATVGFASTPEYRLLKDQFLFNDTLGISGSFNEDFGILTLSGTAKAKDYVAAIRTVRYNLINATELEPANRLVSIQLKSGDVSSATKSRLIGLIYNFQELDIANAFAPTGDMNPHWRIYSPGGLDRYKDAQIKVYNRRGVLVYETIGFNTPWNGTGPEGDLPADTYFYTIDLKYDKKKYKGAVTILR